MRSATKGGLAAKNVEKKTAFARGLGLTWEKLYDIMLVVKKYR